MQNRARSFYEWLDTGDLERINEDRSARYAIAVGRFNYGNTGCITYYVAQGTCALADNEITGRDASGIAGKTAERKVAGGFNEAAVLVLRIISVGLMPAE